MLILTLLVGLWRGIFAIPGQEIPIIFEIQQDSSGSIMIIHNASERIICKDIITVEDSIFIHLPLYDSEFKLHNKGKILTGEWINHARKGSPSIPFIATHNIRERFPIVKQTAVDISDRWETWFNAGMNDSSLAIGQFVQTGQYVTGTFLTESGDHRFLEGVMDGDSLKLSVFDGFFCRLYCAKVSNNMMNGTFYSGNHHQSPMRAIRNSNVQLRDAATLTNYVGKPAFTLPDTDSNMISLNDEHFRNKVIILQIMGSWCPNCMDESEFLSDFYQKNKNAGLEIIGIAFERTSEFAKASTYLKRVKQRFSVEYPILFAGTTDKANVAAVLPGLNNFFSYPTTIFTNRQGEVVHVHAGFNGPASGEEYENYKEQFYARMHQLLTE